MSVTANLTTNVETITATIVVGDETIIVQVSAAARGPAGEAGAAGPNALTTATTTNLTGFISGNGTNIAGATAAASAATANTLVLRDANGGASFAGVTLSGINTNSGNYSQVGGANFIVETTSNANLTTTGSGTVIVSGAGGTTISGGTLTFSPSAPIEQRNGTAAQESRIYGTYTGPGNYRRLALKMSNAGVAQIVAEGGGSGAAGNVLQLPSNTTFADLTATRAALGIQTKTGTSTGLDAVGATDITGLTGYALEADTWYKLELQYLWTSTSSNFQINFVTTGTLLRGGTTPVLGQSMSAAAAVSTTFFVNDTTFALRGSAGESRTNLPAFGYAYFKTGTAGTGKVQLQLLAGTTLSTIVSSCAVLTKQQ
jgi:hypothetical protein